MSSYDLAELPGPFTSKCPGCGWTIARPEVVSNFFTVVCKHCRRIYECSDAPAPEPKPTGQSESPMPVIQGPRFQVNDLVAYPDLRTYVNISPGKLGNELCMVMGVSRYSSPYGHETGVHTVYDSWAYDLARPYAPGAAFSFGGSCPGIKPGDSVYWYPKVKESDVLSLVAYLERELADLQSRAEDYKKSSRELEMKIKALKEEK